MCKYSKIKTEKVTKDILSYLWNNVFYLNIQVELSCKPFCFIKFVFMK